MFHGIAFLLDEIKRIEVLTEISLEIFLDAYSNKWVIHERENDVYANLLTLF